MNKQEWLRQEVESLFEDYMTKFSTKWKHEVYFCFFKDGFEDWDFEGFEVNTTNNTIFINMTIDTDEIKKLANILEKYKEI